MKEIYGDEAVVTDLDRKHHKTRKLAIPDLQVGDFVDYFIREEGYVNYANRFTRELFVFGEEEPVLEYAIHIGAFNEWFALEYRSMNGAPNFKERYDDHMIHMDMLVRNIPPQPVNLWMNPFRQLPIVRVHLRPGARNEKAGRRKEGMIYANPNPTKIRDEAVMEMATRRNDWVPATLVSFQEVKQRVNAFKRSAPMPRRRSWRNTFITSYGSWQYTRCSYRSDRRGSAPEFYLAARAKFSTICLRRSE